ncbi:MAG: hypothetical protein IJN48_03855 [Clostridia bacterium]|nr:hypothetical protein [Clostridia bacterium]
MGITTCSVHVYSADTLENCRCFSPYWQTYIPQHECWDYDTSIKRAKLLSKRKLNAPVLRFAIFDSDEIFFSFFVNGKKYADYSDFSGGKKIFSMPPLIGYVDGYKRRLSGILSCPDAERKTYMLEEYFGVCLVPELFEYDHTRIQRKRNDVLYLSYLEDERRLKGEYAPIKAELVEVYSGKIFNHYFGDIRNSYEYSPHCYLYGFSTAESTIADLCTVKFVGKQLLPIKTEEFAKPSVANNFDPNKLMTDFNKLFRYEAGKLVFCDDAPEDFKGRKMQLPRGYFPLAFDNLNRLILTKIHNGIAIVNTSLKIIAKINVKGSVVDYVDGYILTEGSQSNFAYCYDVGQEVRIYRIYDEE